MLKQFYLCCSLAGFLMVAGLSQAQVKQSLNIMTDDWPPYIISDGVKHQGRQMGSAAAMVELLAVELDADIHWQLLPYSMSFEYARSGRSSLAFPFFKTRDRSAKVRFSKPIFYATNLLYYNRQFISPEQATSELTKFRLGRVAGYSYGDDIDRMIDAFAKVKVFADEQLALQALLSHEIDFLPMAQGVMDYILARDFPERMQLIRPRRDIRSTASLHMIAADNEQGNALMDRLDQALDRLSAMGVQPPSYQMPVSKPDVAELITAEGYPVILGQVALTSGSPQYYTLPQGTRVIVIEWSQKFLQSSMTDRLYKNMMDLSRVVVLNGPHAGRELYVRNMHIQLR